MSTTESGHPQINVAFSSSGKGLHRHLMLFPSFIYLLKAVLCAKPSSGKMTHSMSRRTAKQGSLPLVVHDRCSTLLPASPMLTADWLVSKGTEAKIPSQNHSFAVPHQIKCWMYSDNIQGEDPGISFKENRLIEANLRCKVRTQYTLNNRENGSKIN